MSSDMSVDLEKTRLPRVADWMIESPGWLPCWNSTGGWLGEVLLLGQDELPGFREAQDVLLAVVQQDYCAVSIHEVASAHPLALGLGRR
jgi:hypothetical protein